MRCQRRQSEGALRGGGGEAHGRLSIIKKDVESMLEACIDVLPRCEDILRHDVVDVARPRIAKAESTRLKPNPLTRFALEAIVTL